MKLIQKITAVLKPDTAQSAYIGMTDLELVIDVMKFNDGSIRVMLPTFDPEDHQHRYLQINAFIESLDDLMIVSQVKEIVERLSKTPKNIYLNILSTPYTRYDRPMFETGLDGFGAKCFAGFVNAMKFECVTFLDCHSDVMFDHVNGGFNSQAQLGMVESLIGEEVFNYNLVAPDKGATKKNKKADVICNKVRNPETGQITGMEITEVFTDTFVDSQPLLVIDDICEGGRTFIEVAKVLEERFPALNRELYITHGIFSNDAVIKLCEKYSRIHVYIMKESVYNSLHDLDKSKLNVKYLVNI